MKKKHTTQKRIDRLPERKTRYAVGFGRGLQLRVSPGGGRTWRLRCRVKRRDEHLTLGPWPELDRKAAAREAARARERLEAGPERQPTVREFAERYLAEVAAKARKNLRPVRRYLERDVYPLFGGKRIAEVTPEQMQALIFARRDSGRAAAAAALRDLLERIFRYGQVCRLRTDNPIEATPAEYVYQAKPRERALTAGELRLFFARLNDRRLGRVHGAMLELLLLTLARKSELRLARWTDVDFDSKGALGPVWEIPAENSKTGKPHVVYLSGCACRLFRELAAIAGVGGSAEANPYVLPRKGSLTEPLGASTLNRAMRRVDWGMPRFTPHDLRRTASTLLHEMDYEDDWIETALNHARGGIRGVYNRARYGSQRRRMLEEWAAWLDDLR
jgi:integrase